MDETKPGPDEVRMRGILRRQGVGYDAGLPAVPPRLPDEYPPARERDWLDDLADYNAPHTPPSPPAEPPPAEPEPEPKPPRAKPASKKPKKRKRPKPGKPRTAWDTRAPSPRQSLLDAWDNVPYRLKWLAFHATAAGAGWRLGLVAWSTDTTAWFAAGHWTAPSAWVLYGLGVLVLGLYRRTRGWAWPAAWAAAIPVSSIVAGVLLYAPTQ